MVGANAPLSEGTHIIYTIFSPIYMLLNLRTSGHHAISLYLALNQTLQAHTYNTNSMTLSIQFLVQRMRII